MQRHVSWCVTVEKQIKVKITETEQREEQRRKQQGESKNFKLLHQLLSADLNSDVIDNVNVESLARLSVRQVTQVVDKKGKEWSLDRKSHYNSTRLSRRFYGRK